METIDPPRRSTAHDRFLQDEVAGEAVPLEHGEGDARRRGGLHLGDARTVRVVADKIVIADGALDAEAVGLTPGTDFIFLRFQAQGRFARLAGFPPGLTCVANQDLWVIVWFGHKLNLDFILRY